jgi:hypothetical protein
LGTAVAYAVTASLVAYLHYFGLYLVAWQALGTGLFRPWRDWRVARVVVTAYGLFIVLYVPWLPSLVAQFLNPVWPTAGPSRPVAAHTGEAAGRTRRPPGREPPPESRR